MRFLFGRKKPAPPTPVPLVEPDPLAGFYAEAEAAGRRYEEERSRATLVIEPATHDEWVADGEIALRKKLPGPPGAPAEATEPATSDATGPYRRLSRRP